MAIIPGAVGLTRLDLSVADAGAVAAALDRHRPEVVFNCAAFNAVDRAETETELAFSVNAQGALNAAEACKRRRVGLVHFSTNFVFDGGLNRPYVESDVPRPLSAFGRSKLEGERLVLGELKSALVVRTAALFADRGSAIKGGSFPERVVERARRGEHLRVVVDQMVNPTYTLDLARSVVDHVRAGLTGVVHVVSSGCCSWEEFARVALAECGVEATVEPVTSEAFQAAAQRPSNGCLGSERVAYLRPWRQAIHEWAARRTRSGGAETD